MIIISEMRLSTLSIKKFIRYILSALLDLLYDWIDDGVSAILVPNESDGGAFDTSSSSTSNAMNIIFRAIGNVKVNDKFDVLYVDASRQNVSANEDLKIIFEAFDGFISILLF